MYKKIILVIVLVLEILACVIYLMIGKSCGNNNISPQIKSNESQESKSTTRKYRTSFRPQNIYFPGDPLPEKQLDAIRKLSDTKLKRRFTYKQYGVLKNMLEEVVQMFIKDNIRYLLMKCDLY